MTRTTRSLTRLSIALFLITVGVGSGHIWIAILAVAWFISTIERDQRAATKEATAKRIDRVREDYKKYPYKGRLHQAHSRKD